MKVRPIATMLALIVTALLYGCGGDPPTSDLQVAAAALQSARSAGAEKFASSDLSAAQKAYDDAKGEVDTQNDKMFKNFERANQLIADARSKAQGAESAAKAGKAKAKAKAEAIVSDAATAVGKARAVLDSAPTGKGMEGDVQQLRADLSAAEAELSAARQAVSIEDFDGARSKADGAKQKAERVNDGLVAAQDEYARRVGEARPWYEKI